MMRNVIIHAHIFKNAGTTFDHSLRKNFADGFIDHRQDQELVQGKQEYLNQYLALHPECQALSSHSVHFNIESSESLNLFPVYFIRHPIERIRSVYEFEKKQNADTPGARKAKEMDLEGFVDWYLEESSPATIRNVHTIFLSGQGPSADRLEEKFEQAMTVLEKPAVCINVVDRYDQSMLVMEDKLSADFPGIDLSYVRKNVTDKNPESSLENKLNTFLAGVSQSCQEKIIQKNQWDLALYEAANKRLDKEVQKINDLYARHQDFMVRCKAHH